MNIGAGRVVMQDLPRIDAGRSMTARSPRTPRSPDFIARAEEERRRRASHGPAVAGRRPFAPGPHRGAGAGARRRRASRSRSTPSSTAATRRPRSAVGFLDEIRGRDHGPARRVAHRHRQRPLLRAWTATSAGTASRKPIARWSTAEGEHAPDAQAAIDAVLCREARATNSCCPRVIGDYRRHEGRRRRAHGQFPRRPRARNLGRAARSRLPGLRSAPRVVKFAAALGLTEYSAELNRFLATLFPPEDLARHLRRGDGARPD